MQSRLLFLGTGGDIFVVGKQIRTSGGIVLAVDEDQFHIDPGPGALTMAKLMSLNIRENTALFISGNDLLRANDANAVISAMTHDGLDRRGVLVCPSTVVSDTQKAKAPFVNRYYKDCLEKTITVDNTSKIGINTTDIEVVPLAEDSSIYGFKFGTQRFTLGFIPDCPYTESIPELYKGTDILIVSVADPRSLKRKDHVNSEDAEKLISLVKPQLVIITGFGIKMIEADSLYEARELQKRSGVQVIAAKDGMNINPMSFSATVRQRF